jgi:hypothetical protein
MTTSIEIADKVLIQERLSACAWALDTADIEGFAGCFCSDGLLEWDAFEEIMTWQGRDALQHFAGFLRDQPQSALRQHHVTNTVITPSEDGALAKSFVAVALRQGDGPHLLNVMGWYEDHFRMEDGQWRIARRIIRDWSGPVVGGFAGQTGEKVARPFPPPLYGMRYTRKDD